jgi:DNA replication protein DnaC
MLDITTELKDLRLHGMVSAWTDLVAQGSSATANAQYQDLVRQLATQEFTDTAQNAVLIGGPGTGKTHLSTAIAVACISSKGKRVRF